MDDLITVLVALEGVVLGVMALIAVFDIGGERRRYRRGARSDVPRYL
jgi:hypothetical protein